MCKHNRDGESHHIPLAIMVVFIYDGSCHHGCALEYVGAVYVEMKAWEGASLMEVVFDE